MAGLTAEQVAELVPCPPEQVARLEELGIPDDHGADWNLAPTAVHVVRLMSSFEAAGVPIEDVARGMAHRRAFLPARALHAGAGSALRDLRRAGSSPRP